MILRSRHITSAHACGAGGAVGRAPVQPHRSISLNYGRRDKFWFHPILYLPYEPWQTRCKRCFSRSDGSSKKPAGEQGSGVCPAHLAKDSLRNKVFTYVLAEGNDDCLEVQKT